MRMKFEPLTYCDLFKEVDSLDKKTPLKEGVYWLLFGDNIPVQYKILFEENYSNGFPDIIKVHKAYTTIVYRNTPIKIYLRDIPNLFISKEPVQYAETK